jgi:hypothetical protein
MAMTADIEKVRDDLAFLRSLVQAGDNGQRTFGQAYFASGVCYAGQVFLNVAQGFHLLPDTPTAGLVIGIVPTILFVLLLIPIFRGQKPVRLPGMAARAVGAAFAAVGLSNFALMAVIGSVAWREHSLTIWLIYPCCVFVLQGAAWLIAFMLNRRFWHGIVAAGWFATAIGMSLTVEAKTLFVLIAGVGLVAFMAVPGAVIIRQSREA